MDSSSGESTSAGGGLRSSTTTTNSSSLDEPSELLDSSSPKSISNNINSVNNSTNSNSTTAANSTTATITGADSNTSSTSPVIPGSGSGSGLGSVSGPGSALGSGSAPSSGSGPGIGSLGSAPLSSAATTLPPPSSASSQPSLPKPASSSYLLEDPKLKEILVSDVGTEALLARLKQSILSARELSNFVKKSALLESENISSIRKLSRNTRDSLKKPEFRQGTFSLQLDELVKVNERSCDVGNSFVAALHIMHDELSDLAKAIERSRKSIKETSLRQEKSLLEAEQLAEKAKSKYESLCEEYERVRTGDPTKTKFGFKHSRTPQHEEELQKKVLTSEGDFQQKVDSAQRLRRDLINKSRPATIKQLKDLILECDSGMALQLQKYSNLHETLALNRGFIVAPLKPKGAATGNLTMKEVAAKVDNELDLYNYVLAVPKSKRLNRPLVTFQRHAVLVGAYPTSYGIGGTTPNTTPTSSIPPRTSNNTMSSQAPPPPISKSTLPPISSSEPLSSLYPTTTSGSTASSAAKPISALFPTTTAGSIGSSAVKPGVSPNNQIIGGPRGGSIGAPPSNSSIGGSSASPSITSGISGQFPPGTTHSMPSYGTPLDVLLDYEEATVPRIVFQCIQAVDNFGLEVEGIYRTNGNSNQVQEIKRLFDIDAASVDLLHPSKHLNDIHSVASALKLYFRELPDPLLTRQFHNEFLAAAKINDDVQRRDAIHSTINKLPDPNYTTLRYLIFHLYRVQEREASNRMSIGNLAIVWGPNLMATDYNNVEDMAIEGRILETILLNAYVIFDAE